MTDVLRSSRPGLRARRWRRWAYAGACSVLALLATGPREDGRALAQGKAPPPASASARGEALYDTYCGHCHTEQVHWRNRKLATDWASLKQQVWRWQSNVGQQWSDRDVDEVARVLNARFYHYDAPPRG